MVAFGLKGSKLFKLKNGDLFRKANPKMPDTRKTHRAPYCHRLGDDQYYHCRSAYHWRYGSLEMYAMEPVVHCVRTQWPFQFSTSCPILVLLIFVVNRFIIQVADWCAFMDCSICRGAAALGNLNGPPDCLESRQFTEKLL